MLDRRTLARQGTWLGTGMRGAAGGGTREAATKGATEAGGGEAGTKATQNPVAEISADPGSSRTGRAMQKITNNAARTIITTNLSTHHCFIVFFKLFPHVRYEKKQNFSLDETIPNNYPLKLVAFEARHFLLQEKRQDEMMMKEIQK